MDLDGITQETLEAVKKAQTSGITASTGLFGIDLTPFVTLIPVVTRLRDSLGREGAENGNKLTQWRALTAVGGQPNPFMGFDKAAGVALVNEVDVFAKYAPIGMGYTVTQDSIDLGKGYADARATATLNALNQALIGENKALWGGQNFALPAIAQPTLTQSDTGGSIAASTTLHVAVAARSGENYYYGGSGAACADTTVATSSNAAGTHSVAASVAAVKGAVAYDWFVGSSAGNRKYLTTTTVASVTITAIPTADQALPSLPELSTVVPAGPGPTADSSNDTQAFNGMIATIVGDIDPSGLVTPGNGTSNSATFVDNGANTLTLSGGSIAEIDSFLLSIYNVSRLSPEALWMAPQHAQDLAAKVLSSTAAPTYLQPADKTDRVNAVIGSFAGSYVNRAAGGEIVQLRVDPHLPNGTIVARRDSIPYPGANIDSAWKVRTLRDYADYEYGSNRAAGAGGGPRTDGEVRSIEVLRCKAPLAQGILANVKTG